jgi:hypothetical protein
LNSNHRVHTSPHIVFDHAGFPPKDQETLLRRGRRTNDGAGDGGQSQRPSDGDLAGSASVARGCGAFDFGDVLRGAAHAGR